MINCYTIAMLNTRDIEYLLFNHNIMAHLGNAHPLTTTSHLENAHPRGADEGTQFWQEVGEENHPGPGDVFGHR